MTQARFNRFATRAGMSGALLLVAAVSPADLKMSVNVKSTGMLAKDTASGTYEVAFRSGLARLVLPDGTVGIFDFGAAKVAVLDAKAKTYYLQRLASLVASGRGPSASASVGADTSAQTQSTFGTVAQKVTVTVQQAAPSGSPPQGGRGKGGPPPTGGAPISFSGSGWVVDGSTVQSSVTSVFPLVFIGTPKPLVSSVVQALNQKGWLPVALSFAMSGDSQSASTLAMTVGSVDTAALADTYFAIPADYKQVAQPGGR